MEETEKKNVFKVQKCDAARDSEREGALRDWEQGTRKRARGDNIRVHSQGDKEEVCMQNDPKGEAVEARGLRRSVEGDSGDAPFVGAPQRGQGAGKLRGQIRRAPCHGDVPWRRAFL